MQEQKRGRRIAMSNDELDSFLGEERTCRPGTVDATGRPHVSPLWYVGDGLALWLHSVVSSQRWANLMRDRRVSIVVDGGAAYFELRGAELIGSVEVVGPVPRVDPDPAVAGAERLWADKNTGGGLFFADGKHAWLRLVPEKIVSWDFRTIGA